MATIDEIIRLFFFSLNMWFAAVFSGFFWQAPTIHDANRNYLLPFERGTTCLLTQGFQNPGGSHEGVNALDFNMLEGTLILAARSGTVVGVEDSHTETCPYENTCDGNYILIKHVDGTVAGYMHIMTDGACVVVGQNVDQGDGIALSGNVGYSESPHLHFHISLNETNPSFADVEEAELTPWDYYTSANQLGVDYCS